MGEPGTHDRRICFAETIGIGIEFFVDTTHKENLGFILIDLPHKSLKNVHCFPLPSDAPVSILLQALSWSL